MRSITIFILIVVNFAIFSQKTNFYNCINYDSVVFGNVKYSETKDTSIILQVVNNTSSLLSIDYASILHKPFYNTYFRTLPYDLNPNIGNLSFNITLDRKSSGVILDTFYLVINSITHKIPVKANVLKPIVNLSQKKIQIEKTRRIIGGDTTIDIIVKNTGNTAISFSKIMPMPEISSVQASHTLPYSLTNDVHDSLVFKIKISKGNVCEYIDTLVLKTDFDYVRIPIYFNVMKSNLCISDSSMSFSYTNAILSDTIHHTISLTNDGDYSLKILNVTSSNFPFNISNLTLPFTLNAYESNRLDISISANFETIGNFRDTIYITTDDNDVRRILLFSSVTKSDNYNIFPNPIQSNSKIYFKLEQKSKVKINLYSTNGIFIKELANNTFEQGKIVLDLNISSIEPGAYFLYIDNNGVVNTKTIFIR